MIEGQDHGDDIIDPKLTGKLPKKVALGDLPKFKAVEHLNNHLRALASSFLWLPMA